MEEGTAKAIKRVSLSPEALAALNADEVVVKPRKKLSQKAQRTTSMKARELLFGPTMKPTFKQQLLTFSSFAAIKASWAADYWQRQQTAKKIMTGLHP